MCAIQRLWPDKERGAEVVGVADLTRFVDRLNVGCEKRRGVRADSKVLGASIIEE